MKTYRPTIKRPNCSYCHRHSAAKPGGLYKLKPWPAGCPASAPNWAPARPTSTSIGSRASSCRRVIRRRWPAASTNFWPTKRCARNWARRRVRAHGASSRTRRWSIKRSSCIKGCWPEMIYRARAPLRISFCGGGTDVSPYPEERGGVVLSSTIDKYAYASLRPRDDDAIEVRSLDYDIVAKYDRRDALPYDGELDLVKAVINHYRAPAGMELFLHSDAPPGSGLGSS